MGKEGADEKLCAVCCEISCRKRERCSVALTQDFTTRLKMVGVSLKSLLPRAVQWLHHLIFHFESVSGFPRA